MTLVANKLRVPPEVSGIQYNLFLINQPTVTISTISVVLEKVSEVIVVILVMATSPQRATRQSMKSSYD